MPTTFQRRSVRSHASAKERNGTREEERKETKKTREERRVILVLRRARAQVQQEEILGFAARVSGSRASRNRTKGW